MVSKSETPLICRAFQGAMHHVYLNGQSTSLTSLVQTLDLWSLWVYRVALLLYSDVLSRDTGLPQTGQWW